jgi:hypothetical protein
MWDVYDLLLLPRTWVSSEIEEKTHCKVLFKFSYLMNYPRTVLVNSVLFISLLFGLGQVFSIKYSQISLSSQQKLFSTVPGPHPLDASGTEALQGENHSS